MKLVVYRRVGVALAAAVTASVVGFAMAAPASAGNVTAVDPTFAVNDNPSLALTLSTQDPMPPRSKVTLTRTGTPSIRPAGDVISGFTTDNAPTTSAHVTFNLLDGGSGDKDGPANPGVYSITVVQGPYDPAGISNTNPAPATDFCSGCFTIFASGSPSVTTVTPNGLPQASTDATTAGSGPASDNLNLTYAGTGFTRGTKIEMLLNGVVDTKIDANLVPFSNYPDPSNPSDQANCAPTGAPCTAEITDRTTPTQLIRRINVASDAVTGPRDIRVTNTDGTSSTCSKCFTVNGAPLTGVSPNVANNDPSATPTVRISFTGSGLQGGSIPRLVFVGDAGSDTKNGLTLTGSNASYSATQVSADFDVRNAAPGSNVYQPSLTNPDGSVNACTCRFSVAQTAPATITSVSPATAAQSDSKTVTINGTRLSRGVKIGFSGTGITVTSVQILSPTQAKATLQVASNAPAGTRDVTPVTTDGKSGQACAKCFTITATASPTPSGSPQPQGCPSTPVTVTVNTPTINATGLASVTVRGATPTATIELQGYSQNHYGTANFDNDTTKVDRSGKADSNGSITFNDLRPASNTRVRARQAGCSYGNSAVIEVRAQETLAVKRIGTRKYTFSGRSIPARPGGLIISLYRIVGQACAAGVEPSKCPGEKFVGQARAAALGAPNQGLYSITITFPSSDNNVRDEFVVKTGRDAQNAPGRSNARSLLIY